MMNVWLHDAGVKTNLLASHLAFSTSVPDPESLATHVASIQSSPKPRTQHAKYRQVSHIAMRLVLDSNDSHCRCFYVPRLIPHFTIS